jgi:lipopolysaccharide export system permease protein
VIYRKALTRELALNTGAAVLVLLAIMSVSVVVSQIKKAAIGKIDPEIVVATLAFQAIKQLPLLISVSVFIGVLFTFSRMYRESEMTVWFSSGLSITSWVRPVLEFALPVALIVAVLSLVISPWSQTQLDQYGANLEGRNDLMLIRPGVFTQMKDGNQVFFVDQVVDDGAPLKNVFMQSWRDQTLGVMAAESGYLDVKPDGTTYAVLQKGRRYEGTPGQADYRQFDFEKLSIRLQAKAAKQVTQKLEAMTLNELFLPNAAEPYNRRIAQLHWRMVFPISVIIMALVAIPLAFVNPRAGRSWNFFFAVLIFFIYYNLLTIAERWVMNDRLSPYIGLFPVHGIMIALLLGMFAYRLLALRFLMRGAR